MATVEQCGNGFAIRLTDCFEATVVTNTYLPLVEGTTNLSGPYKDQVQADWLCERITTSANQLRRAAEEEKLSCKHPNPLW